MLTGVLFGNSAAVSGSIFGRPISGGFAALAAKAQAEAAGKPGDKKSDSKDFSTFSSFRRSSSRPVSPTEEKDTDEEDEFVPTAQFEPIFPLPSLVEVKTGEEGEEVLFKARGKLFRFINESDEYKERGIGDMKVLFNPKTSRCRLVMRREQVLKVCANAPLHAALKITKKAKTENACMWMCRDYSESESGIDECFVIKFKDASIADEFIKVFEKACKGGYVKDSKEKVDEEAKTGICSSSSAKLVGENNASKALDSFKQSSYDESKAVEEGEEYDYCDDTEEHFKEVASFEATFVIIDAYKSPMKPTKKEKFTGTLLIAEVGHKGHEVVVLEDDKVRVSHTIEEETNFNCVGPKSMKYLAVGGSRNCEIVVEFKSQSDRKEAFDLIKSIAKSSK
ncbi:unnamed protein product [Dracunculus medinensis]|uniref:RanBD1 domain-containing protein n=1 Tax=Dracunculus medinensis TaxID=318479 RepID=A0A158Q2H1_DRAME|nr:unnamed protein product [Dracunculus medinensis]